MTARTFDFVKAHGTENDFVLLPDPDGTRYADLAADDVVALCNRNTGLGADGVLRVLPAEETEDDDTPRWFMDYRNADGSIAEMCGNGVRVVARYLWHAELVRTPVLTIATRGGDRRVSCARDGSITVEMGKPIGSATRQLSFVAVGAKTWEAVPVRIPNPHAVVFVDTLAMAGALDVAPTINPPSAYPDGANVEFVVDVAPRHIAMRVWERGVGETRSCGTGVCAAAWAAMRRDRVARGTSYTVDVPGGRLTVQERPDGVLLLTGPAELGITGTVTVVT